MDGLSVWEGKEMCGKSVHEDENSGQARNEPARWRGRKNWEESPHLEVAAVLGEVIGDGHVREEHAHDVEVGLQEGKLRLGCVIGGIDGPLGLLHVLGALHSGGVPLLGAVKPHLYHLISRLHQGLAEACT